MMQGWRVTSENRLEEKTQLQPGLEAGKTTDKGVALSDLQMLQEHILWLGKAHLQTHRAALAFETKNVPEDLDF